MYGQQPPPSYPAPPGSQQQPQQPVGPFGYGQPQSQPYGAPPSSMGGMGPPGQIPGGMPGPPGSMTSGVPGAHIQGGVPSTEIRRPQFFSTSGAVPQPVAPTTGPPQFQMGSQMPPPPSHMGGMGAPPGAMGGMPGPPMGMPEPVSNLPPMMSVGGVPGGPGSIRGMPMPGPPMMQPEPVPQYAGQMYGAPPPQSMVGMPDAFGASAMGYSGPGMGYPGGVPGPPPPGAGAGAGAGIPGPGGVVPSVDPAPVSQGPPLPTLAETDLSIKCDPKFLRTTVSKIVNSQAAATSSKVPLGIICSPMKGDDGTTNDQVDVVDFGQTGIVRCKRCRTYINPFASWTDNGRKWRCNICGMVNETHHSYFCHLDSNGRRTDRDERPELSKCSVEFVAPNDYMVRAPQPPVYFFVIDVSSHSASSGMLSSCCSAIKQSLDDLPGRPRTQIGFITFDTSIHFYSLKSTLTSPQMLVVSDTSDIIVPLPEDLLVDLGESRAVVDALLDSIPAMFANSTAVQTCTGPALSAAKRVIQHVGGKLCLFQSSLPTLGEGALKPRENPKFVGTDKEQTLLNPEDPWYKENAVDFSRLQVAVDTFLFSGQYTDLATISVLSKYSSGSCYYYPMFNIARDGARFENELIHNLTRPTGFEAVMRVRCSRGLRLTNYYGNYFIRGNDLLALPNCTSDSTFAIDLQYEDTFLSSEVVTVQAALLYTSSAGERRIRVHTMVLPVTQSASEMIYSMDTYAAVNLMSKQAVEVATKLGFQNARDQVQQTATMMWRSATSRGVQPYGQYGAPQPPGEIEIPPPLQFLPVYAMSLQKNPALRGGQDVRLDERAFYHQRLMNMDVEDSKVFIYPRLFRIDDMTADVGLASDNPDDPTPTAGPFRVRLPGTCSLTFKALLIEGVSNGIFLLENGVEMLFRIGRAVNPNMIMAIFGVPTLDGVDLSTLRIQADSCDFAFRLNAVIVALRAERGRHMQLKFIKESDGSAEAYFARYLVEDRAFMMDDYDTYYNRLVSNK